MGIGPIHDLAQPTVGGQTFRRLRFRFQDIHRFICRWPATAIAGDPRWMLPQFLSDLGIRHWNPFPEIEISLTATVEIGLRNTGATRSV
jgi:hypothetical protein